MKKISRRQIKIIAAGLIVLVSFICFWVFIYSPQGKKLDSIKKELTFTESQIAEINKITQGKELSMAVEKLNNQLISISDFLPFNQEEVISNLSNKAREFKIEINSIVPQKKSLLEDKVKGYIIEQLPISMNMLCELRDLGRYLGALRDDFPYSVRVKNLEIKGQGEGKPVLDISLEIIAYLSKSR